MILVDTSVWISHLRAANSVLREALVESLVLTHPFVVGELACGNLKHRSRFLGDLNALPSLVSSTHEEALRVVEDRRLWGYGIGCVDAHLLASAIISYCRLWTLDQQLDRAAGAAGVKIYRYRGG